MQKASIYERIGGAPAVAAAVDLFYKKQLEDTRVKGFFQHIDLEKLKAHQRDFLTKVFGGPDNYKGRNMLDSHKNLYITEWHFDAVKQNLMDTLEELKVPKDLIAEIDPIVESTRKEIVFHG